jgi:lysyl-tRNA synthetase class 2
MLRNRQIGGFKFRRQMPLGPYVVDFCCPEAKLVIELDSSYHAGMQQQDAQRDQKLGSLGYQVLRITAGDLATNRDGVLSTIHRIAIERVRALE